MYAEFATDFVPGSLRRLYDTLCCTNTTTINSVLLCLLDKDPVQIGDTLYPLASSLFELINASLPSIVGYRQSLPRLPQAPKGSFDEKLVRLFEVASVIAVAWAGSTHSINSGRLEFRRDSRLAVAASR